MPSPPAPTSTAWRSTSGTACWRSGSLPASVGARPEAVSVIVTEAGPVRGRLIVRRRFRWPERLRDGARAGDLAVDVETVLELRTGERLVRVETTLENRGRDHRLRSWFPLPQ